MRKTINISVPEDMFSYIHEKGRSDYYGSASDYIRSVVRRDQFQWDRKKPKTRARRVNDIFIHRQENDDQK